MKILLIQPRMHKRPMDTDLKTCMSPPLGLLTLMGLTPPGHDVRLVNENAEKIPKHFAPDLVGITVTLDVFPRACEIAAAYRSRRIPVVAGGIHITCCPEDCAPFFSAICVGPAERVWAKIIGDAARGCLQPVYKDFENFAGEEIASPKYDAIDTAKYLMTNIVTTSRGCPCRCDFCYNSNENRCHVRRPVEHVVADIRALGARHIYFPDDNFIGDIAYTRQLLNALEPLKLKWRAAVTANILDHLDLLDRMAETGCQSLFIGFESVNPAALAGVHKHQNRPERYAALAWEIHRRGIMINASMVFGLDGDGPEVFANTLDWLVENKIETLTSHILTPYPGTRLYRDMHAAGRITDRDLSHYNTAHVVYQPGRISPEELHAGYLKMYRDFYSFRNIWRRRPENPKQRFAYFAFNLFYRKFGRATSAICRIIPMRAVGQAGEWLAARLSRAEVYTGKGDQAITFN